MYAAVIEPHPALLGPFAILLLSNAIFPLIPRQHWERDYQKLCALLAVTTCSYYVFALDDAARVQHAAGECDFHCCGRHILCRGRRNPFTHPATRLAARKRHVPVQRQHPGKFHRHDWCVDAFTRPFLHMNRGRGNAMHVAFFIFTVGNLGGALLPVGPPLFLGYIKGVPFLWTALHCWPQWLIATVRCSQSFLSQI
jgi:hypothetical protein